MSLNKVMLIGNVGRDPEIRYLDGNNPNQGATKVAQFTLATTERYRDRNGELRENTEWHNIVAWRNSADVAEKFIRKGTQVYIEGKLRTRSWTDQTGNKRFTTEIAVDNLQLLGKRSDNPGAAGSPAGPAAGYQQSQQPAYQQPRPQQPSYQQPQTTQAQPVDIGIDDNPTDDLPF
ncbi:MAG: single-stranded DNA-binding protein [Bacteroidales bacterium]|nr:single-stranded DNA-binding protein [Bacteroidales bacterium]